MAAGKRRGASGMSGFEALARRAEMGEDGQHPAVPRFLRDVELDQHSPDVRLDQGNSEQFRRDDGGWQDGGSFCVHGVSYTAEQSHDEGWTIVF
jgi:hypothetical protein